jgi:hypothetical protein
MADSASILLRWSPTALNLEIEIFLEVGHKLPQIREQWRRPLQTLLPNHFVHRAEHQVLAAYGVGGESSRTGGQLCF